MDSAREDFIEHVQRMLANLPPEQQHEATLQFAAVMIKHCDRDQILAVRSEFLAQAEEHPLFAEAVDLIDGHLALREIGQESDDPPT